MTIAIHGDKVVAQVSTHLLQTRYRAAFSHTPERVKIRCHGLPGWELAVVLTPVA